MVNRVLIRLKVVQLLYSYLLTRSEFKIENPVETSSPDRRYSFQAYAELLLLVLELSGQKVVTDRETPASVKGAISGAKFSGSKVAAALMSNDDIRNLVAEYGSRMPEFDGAIEEAVSRLKNSSAYRALLKVKNPTSADEIEFWTLVVRTTLIKTPAVVESLRTNPGFTVRGMEMGAKMLVETLGSYSDTSSVLASCKNDLKRSLDQAYELYHQLLRLPVDITHAQEERLEAAASKYLPTPEDLNPDRRFVDSKLIADLAEHPAMEEHPSIWANDPVLIQRLLDLVLSSEPYKEYMATPGEKTEAEDAELWRKLLRQIIFPSEDLAEALESKSIFWNDDLEVMSGFTLKTLKQISKDGVEAAFQPEFKDEEDADFGPGLFDAVVKNREEYRTLIDGFINSSKWDSERIALMDIVILLTAIAEMINYPKIPLSVTANEYVEIANWYSTSRSGSFVNGMIAAIAGKLRSENKLHKTFN